MLIRWRIGNGSFATSLPATKAWPEVGRRRVSRILMSVAFPAPFGPRRPKSSPSRIWRDTPSNAVTGPRDSSSFGLDLRHHRFFFPANTRVRSRVSTAYGMEVRSCSKPSAGVAGLDGQPLPVSGDVPGDPVAHQDAPHVGQLRDLPLVVLEVVREFVRIELREFDGDSLDVRRPDITQRSTPLSSRERSKGCVLNKASEENRDANRFHGARGASLVSDGLSGQLLNRDLGYARMGPRAAPSPRSG